MKIWNIYGHGPLPGWWRPNLAALYPARPTAIEYADQLGFEGSLLGRAGTNRSLNGYGLPPLTRQRTKRIGLNTAGLPISPCLNRPLTDPDFVWWTF